MEADTSVATTTSLSCAVELSSRRSTNRNVTTRLLPPLLSLAPFLLHLHQHKSLPLGVAAPPAPLHTLLPLRVSLLQQGTRSRHLIGPSSPPPPPCPTTKSFSTLPKAPQKDTRSPPHYSPQYLPTSHLPLHPPRPRPVSSPISVSPPGHPIPS